MCEWKRCELDKLGNSMNVVYVQGPPTEKCAYFPNYGVTPHSKTMGRGDFNFSVTCDCGVVDKSEETPSPCRIIAPDETPAL